MGMATSLMQMQNACASYNDTTIAPTAIDSKQFISPVIIRLHEPRKSLRNFILL